MIVYKIVCNIFGQRYSAVTNHWRWCKYYPPQEWVRGFLGTPLLAFDTLENATSFSNKFINDNFEVWEAEADNAKPQETVALYSTSYLVFWKRDDIQHESRPAPRGTLACNQIKLIRRLV